MSEKNGNRPYDEQTLAKVLEAAYVLQEHNRAREEKAREVKKATPAAPTDKKTTTNAASQQAAAPAKKQARPPAPKDYALVLAQIVETQHSIQVQQLELEPAISLIAERAAEFARADGAGIAIREGASVHYGAATGAMALPIGTEVLMEKALCAASLRVGHVVRCADVNVEFLVDLDECRRRGIQAMIAAPVFVAGNVAGALELYYGASNAFVEQDVHTCQLMAGLAGEALARKQGVTPAKSDDEAEVAISSPEKMGEVVLVKNALPIPKPVQPANVVGSCLSCGAEIVGDEQFCGTCGLPVGAKLPALNGNSLFGGTGSMPAKTATELAAAVRAASNRDMPADFEAFVGPYTPKAGETEFEYPRTVEAPEKEVEGEPGYEDQASATVQAANWSSAAEAREFLEKFAAGHGKSSMLRFLKARRGDIYLALALVLVAVVIRWGIWSGHPVNATSNPAAASHHRPEADLPLYDRLLIKFGLAEAPDPPEYKGNPDSQVWVDVQTGLYYCSGADLYGKTPRGKVTSQRTAQMDQYEPAARKPCD